jgi:hypothetical protein
MKKQVVEFWVSATHCVMKSSQNWRIITISKKICQEIGLLYPQRDDPCQLLFFLELDLFF